MFEDTRADALGQVPESTGSFATSERRSTFDEVVAENSDFILRTLRQLGVGAVDIDDVTQEVLRGIVRGLPTFDPALACNPASAMRGWLFGICERQAASLRRRQRRVVEILDRDDDVSPSFGRGAPAIDAPSPEESMVEGERRELLFELLATLEPGRRAVIVAYELEGVEMKDIAAGMSIPLNTAWNRLRLAREDLRAAWRRLDAARRY